MHAHAQVGEQPPKYRLKLFFQALQKFRRITPHQALVYLALLSYCGPEGCYPSHATIATEAGVSDRTVRKALREARLRGWLSWTNTRKGRRQSSNRYTFTIETEFLNKILNGVRKLKWKSAEICRFFSRNNVPGSPYNYIKRETKRLWKTINPMAPVQTEWQKLFQQDRQAAIRLALANYTSVSA